MLMKDRVVSDDVMKQNFNHGLGKPETDRLSRMTKGGRENREAARQQICLQEVECVRWLRAQTGT